MNENQTNVEPGAAEQNTPLWLVLAAFIAASSVPAFALALAMPLFEGMPTYPQRVLLTLPFYVVAAAVMTVVLGLPAYWVLKRWLRPTLVTCCICGAFVASGPWVLLSLLPTGAEDASVAGHATVVHGHATIWQFIFGLGEAALIAPFGLLGGVAFWSVVRFGSRLRARSLFVAASAGAAAVACVALLAPSLGADRSCHNPLRDGRRGIAPVASFDLSVGREQYQSIGSMAGAFAQAGGWSLRSDVRPGEDFPWLQISLCKEPGTNITVQSLPDNRVMFAVYQPQGGISWRAGFRALYQRISARWPARIVFEDEQGRPDPRPEWVRNDSP